MTPAASACYRPEPTARERFCAAISREIAITSRRPLPSKEARTSRSAEFARRQHVAGFVVLPDARHRARLGLVKLGVAAADVAETCAELLARAGELELTGARAVIQPQLAHQGEIAVGAVRDPHYGPALLIGPGGSRVEQEGLARQVIRLPARPGAIARALADAPPQLSTVEFAAMLARLGDLVVRVPALAELDINPLLLTTDGAPVAVDSLVVVSEEA
ncbi:acetate--CoA ligase family protein [Saccharopolyspora shandongensis]|uniref:acetate--CoA ligase family protein n=1 Tax=Saccharopolyspora shandongensis TaxID=418495 RepID=UPI0033D71DEC